MYLVFSGRSEVSGDYEDDFFSYMDIKLFKSLEKAKEYVLNNCEKIEKYRYSFDRDTVIGFMPLYEASNSTDNYFICEKQIDG